MKMIISGILFLASIIVVALVLNITELDLWAAVLVVVVWGGGCGLAWAIINKDKL